MTDSTSSGGSQSLSSLYDMRREVNKLISDRRKISGIKRKRKSTKKRSYKRRRTGGFQGYARRGPVIMTPYGTLSGFGGYEDSDMAGERWGAKLGGWLGGRAHQLFKNVTGFGDYTIKSNTLYNGTDPPNIVNTFGEDATVIRHREYVGDLMSGDFPSGGTVTDFHLGQWTINPGNPALFPWLSAIAANYQSYELRGMIVELKSLTSDYSNNSVLGSMFIGTQYNVLESPPEDKRDIENLQYSTSCKPSESMIHGIECDRSLNVGTHLYVNPDGVRGEGDARLYDLGQIFIGSQGIPVENAPIAEIWLSYEVALYKPQVGPGLMQSWRVRDRSTTGDIPWGLGVGRDLIPDKDSYAGITARTSELDAHDLILKFPDIDDQWHVTIVHKLSPSGFTPTVLAAPGFSLSPGVTLVACWPTSGTDIGTGLSIHNWDSIPATGKLTYVCEFIVNVKCMEIRNNTAELTVAMASDWTGITHALTIMIDKWNRRVDNEPIVPRQ